MKRTWITVKRGLLEPKHRFALGELVWLFIYILDRTNWEAGVIADWSDKATAEDFEMPIATLRDQRMKLQEKGYITCERKQHGIRIIVHNWTNPKEYTGEKYNVKVPSDTPSHTLDTTPSDTPSHTVPSENLIPSIISKVKSHKSLKDTGFDFPESLNTPEFQEAWQRWLTFRSEIKHKITPSTQQAQFKKLSAYPVSVAIAMIEQSIANGWQGLFEVKSVKGNKNDAIATDIFMRDLERAENVN